MSQVRLALLHSGEAIPLTAIDHSGGVAGSNRLNPLDFEVDLAALREHAPRTSPTRLADTGTEHWSWAFNCPWYEREAWASPRLSDAPLEPYASASASTIGNHVRQAQVGGRRPADDRLSICTSRGVFLPDSIPTRA